MWMLDSKCYLCKKRHSFVTARDVHSNARGPNYLLDSVGVVDSHCKLQKSDDPVRSMPKPYVSNPGKYDGRNCPYINPFDS